MVGDAVSAGTPAALCGFGPQLRPVSAPNNTFWAYNAWRKARIRYAAYYDVLAATIMQHKGACRVTGIMERGSLSSRSEALQSFAYNDQSLLSILLVCVLTTPFSFQCVDGVTSVTEATL